MSEKRMRKIPAIISYLLALVIMLGIFPMLADANFSNGYPDKDIEVTPSGLQKENRRLKLKLQEQQRHVRKRSGLREIMTYGKPHVMRVIELKPKHLVVAIMPCRWKKP